jgi:hypothetical protein
MGVLGWAGLCRISRFQSGKATISKKVHQVGGFGDPPKVRRRVMKATATKIMMDLTAATWQYALEKSYLARKIHLSGWARRKVRMKWMMRSRHHLNRTGSKTALANNSKGPTTGKGMDAAAKSKLKLDSCLEPISEGSICQVTIYWPEFSTYIV